MERLLVNGIEEKDTNRIDRYRRLAHRIFYFYFVSHYIPLRSNRLWSICCGRGGGVASEKIPNGRSSLLCLLLQFISIQFLIDIVYVFFFSLCISITRFARFMAIGDIDTPKLIITTALKMVRWHRFHCTNADT